jgi:hypothetical protein
MATRIPSFSYTGKYRTEMIGDMWYIYLLTDGALKMNYSKTIDAFLVGGGGGGGGAGGGQNGAGGGGGGYTLTQKNVDITAGERYEIFIGAGGKGGSYSVAGKDGGETKAFGLTALGGKGTTGNVGGDGGSGGGSEGGSGGSNGSDGVAGSSYHTAGKGQGTTTRAFGEVDGALYAGGGGGGNRDRSGSGFPGGEGGGGSGSNGWGDGSDGTPNTGGGGGGAGEPDDGINDGGNGGSGIVIIRGYQDDYLNVYFDGTRLQRIIFDGQEVKHLIQDGTKIFMERVRGMLKWSKQETRLLLPAL